MTAQAQANQYDFRQTRLANGLRVITLEDRSSPIAAVQVWYHVGSKNERPDRQGFAHMFEHMMFRGTDLLGPEEHFALIRGTGGTCNAFTSFDYTAYVNTVPSNQLDLALWLEAERMMFLKVTQENFDTERQVVIEERRQDLNEPYGAIWERIMPVIFQQHPYRWLPIGSIDHLNAADIGELQHFWDTYYVPANATLVIAGDISHKDALKKAEQYFAWMPALPKPEEVLLREPPQEAPRNVTVHEQHGPVPLARYIYRAVPEAHPDATALQCLTDILGRGNSSRLYRDLVKQRQICQDAYGYLWGLEQDGTLTIGAELLPEGDLEAVFPALDEHVERIRTEPVAADELDKVKNQLRRRVVTDTLTVRSKADRIGRTVIERGGPEWLNEQLDAIDAVTVEDIRRVAQEYLKTERRNAVRIVPTPDQPYEPSGEAAPAAPPSGPLQKAGVVRPDDFPTAPPLHALLAEIPKPRRKEYTLENGLRVVVLPNGEVPFVSAMLGLRNGPWTEDPQRPGVASMALALLTKGTANYSAEELAETVERNALTLSGRAGASGSSEMDVGSVSATALADKTELALELLAEVVRRPTFPDGEVEVFRKQRMLQLKIREEDPRHIAMRELRQRVFKDHPYARYAAGELADVKEVQRDDVAAWWKANARPEKAVLYVAGDVRPRKARKWAEAYFGDWQPEAPAPGTAYPPVPEREATHIYLIDHPGAVQSQIRLGQTSLTRTDPGYFVSRVYTQILGGGFSSRINRVIRIERGLTYGAWGYIEPQMDAGLFSCGTFTKTESTAEALQGLLEVVQSMALDPPAGEELAEAKSYLVGSFPRGLETPRDVMTQQWIIDAYGLPEDYLQRAMDAYNAVTTGDLETLAAERIDPERLTIVVVGDAAALEEPLGAIAPVTVVRDAIPAPTASVAVE